MPGPLFDKKKPGPLELYGRNSRVVLTNDPLEVWERGNAEERTIPIFMPSAPSRFDTAPYEQEVPSYLRNAIQQRYAAELEGLGEARSRAERAGREAVTGYLATALPQAVIRAMTGAPTRDVSSEQVRGLVHNQLQRMQQLQEEEDRLGSILPEEANIRIQQAKAQAEQFNKNLRLQAEQTFQQQERAHEQAVGQAVTSAAQTELGFEEKAANLERQKEKDALTRRYMEAQIDQMQNKARAGSLFEGLEVGGDFQSKDTAKARQEFAGRMAGADTMFQTLDSMLQKVEEGTGGNWFTKIWDSPEEGLAGVQGMADNMGQVADDLPELFGEYQERALQDLNKVMRYAQASGDPDMIDRVSQYYQENLQKLSQAGQKVNQLTTLMRQTASVSDAESVGDVDLGLLRDVNQTYKELTGLIEGTPSQQRGGEMPKNAAEWNAYFDENLGGDGQEDEEPAQPDTVQALQSGEEVTTTSGYAFQRDGDTLEVRTTLDQLRNPEQFAESVAPRIVESGANETRIVVDTGTGKEIFEGPNAMDQALNKSKFLKQREVLASRQAVRQIIDFMGEYDVPLGTQRLVVDATTTGSGAEARPSYVVKAVLPNGQVRTVRTYGKRQSAADIVNRFNGTDNRPGIRDNIMQFRREGGTLKETADTRYNVSGQTMKGFGYEAILPDSYAKPSYGRGNAGAFDAASGIF